MSRSYENVLEDTIKNQVLQICNLISTNEALNESNKVLAHKLQEFENVITNSKSANNQSNIKPIDPIPNNTLKTQ